jgi:Ca2+/Na+ antiporter
MVMILSALLFLILCTLTFSPALKLLYARNPPFVGMILTLSSCFLGVYLAIELSRSSEREDRMARAATLMEMTQANLSASRGEARPSPAQSQELAELLNNVAVLEQISPESLKALLASQANMAAELTRLASASGHDRKHHLNGYLREVVFAQGVLTAEAEFQRGRIGRNDLSEILQGWSLKKSLASI